MLRTILLTVLALVAFAANSLLCRLALGDGLMDAAGFTAVRLVSGAVVLLLLTLPAWRTGARPRTNLSAVAALFIYMIFFSYAYLTLSAGTGALLLFGAVQLTMFAVALGKGERFTPLAWTGFILAVAGLVFLVAPGVTAPDFTGALLMVIAGMAWGGYSLLGRGTSNALHSTANNFIFCVPLALISAAFLMDFSTVTPKGLVLAIASGALASGLGYVAWYAALKGLQSAQAATVQLAVPAIAALGGVMLLGESLGPRLLLASAATLGGIALVLLRRGVD